MSNETVIIELPIWFIQFVHLVERNWIAVVGTVILCLLVAVVTQIKKRKWALKHEEEKVKRLVKWFVLASSTIFGIAGSLAYFISQNMPILENLPYLGEYIPTVLGGVWALYNFRLNKTFERFQTTAKNWVDTPSDQTSTESPQPLPESSQPQPEGFL